MNRGPGNILDRPLGRGRGSQAEGSVSLSAFAYLYSELVQYHQSRVASISELERRLESSGYSVGLKVLELLAYRARESKRETRVMSILQFVSSTVWKSLFGKAADSLERSIDHADEFMIVDYEPITSTFVSVPSDLGQLSVDAYISGIIAGVLDGAGFTARVTAHSVTLEEGEHHAYAAASQKSSSSHHHHSSASSATSAAMSITKSGSSSLGGGGGGGLHALGMPPRKEKAVFLVKFSSEVLARDAALDR